MTEQTVILKSDPGNEIAEGLDVPLARHGILAAMFGVVTGAAAGLIGVGGGEFRMPLLIHLFRHNVKSAAGVNLVVGLVTVCFSLFTRWRINQFYWGDTALALTFSVLSLAGAVVGARQAHRLSSRILRGFVCAYLLIVGLWMIFESLSHTELTLLNPSGLRRLVLASVLGFVIPVISAALGVAGGEMRIPVLLYLFGIPIKTAGTISLMVSIPTVAAGAGVYRKFGHLPNGVLLVAVSMAVGSIIGVFIGASFLPFIDKHLLKAILGLILLLATIAVALPHWKHERR